MQSREYTEADAIEYLHSSAALREALNIAASTELEPHKLGEGEHNVNFRFGDPASDNEYVLRVNVVPQPFHKDQVAYEYAALEALEPSGCTPKPYFLDNSATAPGKGALVIGYCPGAQLDFDNLRDDDFQRVARILANVHAVSVPQDSVLFRPADPLRELFDECLQRFALYQASAFEDERITRWAQQFIERAQEALNDAPVSPRDCTHIINTETLASHFLLPEQPQDSPGWFIDWERPLIGEIAQDVAYFVAPTTSYWDSEYVFRADAANRFIEDYWQAVDGRFERGSFDARFRSWRMMTALRSVTWCCRALITYNAASTAHQTSKTAQKLPVYLSDDFMHLLAKDCFELE